MSANECDFLDKESLVYLDDIVEKIKKDRVIPFIGAGLSRNARRKDGYPKKFPLWSDLIEKMLAILYVNDKNKIDREKYLYEKVADKYEAVFGRNNLLQFLINSLDDVEFGPGRIHRLISQFNWEIISTNFDTLIERGYELTNKIPSIIYTDSDLALNESPRIFKINGCIRYALDEIIITGEDFRTFGDKKPLIELYVKKCFIESTVLFIGFSLNDPAFNMIHGWVRDRLTSKKANRFAYSIQVSVDDLEEQVWKSRGIRFIKLSHDRKISEDEIEDRIFKILNCLYEAQVESKTQRISTGEGKKGVAKSPDHAIRFQDCMDEIKKKAEKFEQECEIESSQVQMEIQADLVDCLKKINFTGLLEILWDTKCIEENKKGRVLGEDFIRLMLGYFCRETKDNILGWMFRRVLEESEKTGGEIFLNEKLTGSLQTIIAKLLIEIIPCPENPDLWIMAIYIAFRSGITQKLMPVEFFSKGFHKIQEYVSLDKNRDRSIAKELHHYWLMIVLWIGPIQNGVQMLNICRKMPPHNCKMDISENIHYQLEVFFYDRSKHLDLFLRALHKLRSSNNKEGLFKFLLLNSFLEEYKKEGFNDLFVEAVYEYLFGKFREKYDQLKNIYAKVSAIKIDNLKSLIRSLFTGVEQGQSLLSTGTAEPFLDCPTNDIIEVNLDAGKQTAVGEIMLLAVIFDNFENFLIEDSPLKKKIKFMMQAGMIDVNYFLDLLLFRVQYPDLIKIEQTADNGVRRLLFGLAAFMLCALPYLEFKELKKIKKFIQEYLSQVKIPEVKEALLQIVGYIATQLPGEDFSELYEKIFFIACAPDTPSIGLRYLTLSKEDLEKPDILKYSQLSMILDKSLKNRGTPFDRDFIDFMLNHDRQDLFPENKRINDLLKTYFDSRFENQGDLSLQWLMDVQSFLDKGFVSLEDKEMKNNISEFIKVAFVDNKLFYEWKYFSARMIPVYRTLGHLFSREIIENILDGYLKDVNGEMISYDKLDEKTADDFAGFLKEVYVLDYHPGLKEKVLGYVKELVKNGFTGVGCLAVSWDALNEDGKKLLSSAMLGMWQPGNGKGILKGIQAAGEFLKYKTEETLMDELSHRVLYSAFSGATETKIALLGVLAGHKDIDTNGSKWFQTNHPKILEILNILKHEKDLTLLRALVKLVEKLPAKHVKGILKYLAEKAPFEEIKRSAKPKFAA